MIGDLLGEGMLEFPTLARTTLVGRPLRRLVRGDNRAIVSAMMAHAVLAFPEDREDVGRDAEDRGQPLANAIAVNVLQQWGSPSATASGCGQSGHE
jgi:hypothetical protein